MASERGEQRLTHHLPALDGIRGLAVLWVIAHNTTDLLGAPPSGPYHLLALLANPGWVGVQLFFALSGFLVTANLLDTQGATNYYSGFYARRTLRILPLYFLVLSLLLVVLPAVTTAPALLQPTIDHQLWLWLFVSNWTPIGDCDFYGFGHFWSLAVEEQFYLFWPLLVHRARPKPLFFACVLIALIAFVTRSGAALGGMQPEAIYDNTIFRLDALALGSAGAALLRIPEWSRALRPRLLGIGAGTVVLFLVGTAATRAYDTRLISVETIGYSILAMTAAVLVTTVALFAKENVALIRALAWKPLRSCGKYSYAMYVVHVPIHKLLGTPLLARLNGHRAMPDRVALYALAVLSVSYLLARVSYHTFEKRWLALKGRFAPRFAAT